MDGSPSKEATVKHVFNTRPLLNFTNTDRIGLLEELLGKPIYVPDEVHRQWKGARSRLEEELQAVPPDRRDPFEVQRLDRLQRAARRFRGNPFRVVKLLGEERDLTLELERDHYWIHPGEADVLALCLHRGPGWTAVLDDRPAHDLALELGVPTVGTIELLLEAVRQELLSLTDGEHVLDEMRASWPRAPGGRLQEYLSGKRAVW